MTPFVIFFSQRFGLEKGTQHSLVCSKSLVVWAGKKGASESGNLRNVYFSITCQWRFSSDLRNVKSDPSQDWAQSGFPSPREKWRYKVGGHHNCQTFVVGNRINFNVTHIGFERPSATTLTMNPRYKIGFFVIAPMRNLISESPLEIAGIIQVKQVLTF